MLDINSTQQNIHSAGNEYFIVVDNVLNDISKILAGDNKPDLLSKSGKVTLRFSKENLIRLIENGEILEIDMVQTPGEGVKSMMYILEYALDNGFKKIVGKAQPQKIISEKPERIERRTKILKRFYNKFGFMFIDDRNGELELSHENIQVLKNKIKYYSEHGKML